MQMRHYTAHDGIASNVVNTLMQDSRGFLWLGTDVGLTRFDGYSFKNYYHIRHGVRCPENVISVMEDTLHNLLLVRGTDYKVYPFDLSSMTFTEPDSTMRPQLSRWEALRNSRDTVSLRTLAAQRGVSCRNMTDRLNAVKRIVLPGGNELWTTIDNGIYVCDTLSGRIRHYTAADPHSLLDTDCINDAVLDRSGALWIATAYSGVYCCLTGNTGVCYHTLDDSNFSEMFGSVRSFSETADNNVIIGDMSGRLFRYSLDTHTCKLILQTNHRVYATMTDLRGRFCMGTRGGGVWVGERHLNTTDSLPANIIFDLMQTPDSTLWIASLDCGLLRGREDTLGRFSFSRLLPKHRLHKLLYDGTRMWIASESGLYVLAADSVHCVMPDVKVVDLCQSNDGTVYAATVGMGLQRVHCTASGTDAPVSEISEVTGLASSNVKAVRAFPDGTLAIGTDAGISIVGVSGVVRNINSPYGTKGDVTCESAALLTSDGRILVGNLCGFAELLPRVSNDINNHPATPSMPRITDIEVEGQDLLCADYTDLRLSHKNNSIAFAFSTMDSYNRDATTYSYRLRGHDREWSAPTRGNRAVYNNLPPGRYNFEVRAALSGTGWSDTATCTVHIRHPWWRTWWAYAVYAGLCILFVWYEWHQYQCRQSLRRQLDMRLSALYEASPQPATLQNNQPVQDGDAEVVRNEETNTFLHRLDGIIQENLLTDSLDMSFLSAQMCMSHPTLYRRLKAATGMTLNEYVRKHRLTKAYGLLLKGVSASETALDCGFSSLSYFSRRFKSEYGISPSEVNGIGERHTITATNKDS